MSFSILFFWFSQVLSSCEAKTMRLKRTTIQSKFKDKLKQWRLTKDGNFCPTLRYPTWPNPNGLGFTQPNKE